MSTKHGSLSAQALKRLQGGELILKGYDNATIVDICDVTIRSVTQWRKKLNEHNGDLLALVRKKALARSQGLMTSKNNNSKTLSLGRGH